MAEAALTIRQIATNVVAAEVENGLDPKKIGRGSPKLAGVNVYNQLAMHLNREMAKSPFVAVVDKARQTVMQKFGKHPDKLVLVEGSTTDTSGEHTGVDLKRIAKHLAPVFEFVCGPAQRVADCRLPKAVLSMFKAIDQELLAALLARREQQLTAQKLWSASSSPGKQKEKLKASGWTDSQFKKLVDEGVLTAAKIHEYRVNMFTGLLFTRCVSPFILYSIEELQQASSERTASPAKPLVKLSEGANKLFRKHHAAFVKDFIDDSNKFLPEESAGALATITAGEERFFKVKKSQKSPSRSGKAYARLPGRNSAPVLPQGGDFRKLMEQERKTVDAETPSPAPRRELVDYKTRRDAAIDGFKSSHASDFGDEDFAIAFSLGLRQWKRDNRDADIAAVPLAMKRLYLQVKKGLAQPDGPLVQSQSRGLQGSGPGSSSATSMPDKASNVAASVSAPVTLSDERQGLLESFAKNPERKASLERYPALKQRIEQEAIAWTREDTGGNFVMALKTIFEEELFKCFYGTYQLMIDPPDMSPGALRMQIGKWKTAHKGKDLNLEALWTIIPALAIHAVEPSFLKRNAESVTEAFLRRDEIAAELLENPLLKKRFLNEIRSWIASGAYSTSPETAVRQVYHKELTTQYQEGLQAAGAKPDLVGQVGLAAMQWSADNATAVLTTAVLDTLLASIKKSE